jgi:DNA repair exonuclease SbcCD ATPase subunit
MLVIPSMINPVELYADRRKIATLLDDIGCQAHSVEHDLSTVKGRALIAGTAYKVARSKTYLDGLGKELVSVIKQQAAAVDAERKYIRDTLDELRDSIRKPLDEWEAADEARKAAHQSRLASLNEMAASIRDTPSILDAKVVQLNTLMDYQWEEFSQQAEIKSAIILKSLEEAQEAAIARIAEAERQKGIAAQQEAEKAKLEAERKEIAAQQEAEKAKLEAERKEIAAQQEAEKAKLEAERRELAEMRAKLIEERTVETATALTQPVVVPIPQKDYAPEPDSQVDKWKEARKTIQSWITFGMHTNVTDYIAYLEAQS